MQAHGEVGDRLGPPIDVALDAAPIDAANPVVAALPDDVYAVAWTDGKTVHRTSRCASSMARRASSARYTSRTTRPGDFSKIRTCSGPATS